LREGFHTGVQSVADTHTKKLFLAEALEDSNTYAGLKGEEKLILRYCWKRRV